MKRLLAVLAVFALVMGAAFAQNFSAGGNIKAQLIGGDSEMEEAEQLKTTYSQEFWMTAGKTNDENTAGVKAAIGGGSKGDPINFSWYYTWWKPIEQLFIKMGKVGEEGKYWVGAGMVDWDFQSNDLLCDPVFSYWNGFPGSVLGAGHGGWGRNPDNDTSGLQVSVLPVEGLALNFGWTLGSNIKAVWGDTFAVQAVYDIEGIGRAAVGFRNSPEGENKDIGVQWDMPIDVMNIQLAMKFYLNPDVDDFKPPIDIGLGFRYGNPWGDDFWISARAGLSIGTAEGAPTKIGFQLCPSIELGIFRLYAPVGIGMIVQEDADTLFTWSLNPYIRKAMGGIEFWAGLKLYNGSGNVDGEQWEEVTKANTESVKWAIPIGFLWAW